MKKTPLRERFQLKKIEKSFQDLLLPLSARPALASFFGMVFISVPLHFPRYFLPFAVSIIILTAGVAPFARKWVLFFLCLSLTLYFNGLSKNSDPQFINNPPLSGKGFVKTVLPRSSGNAVILKTDFGKIRLIIKDFSPPLPGDSIYWKAEWYPVFPPTIPGTFNSPLWLKNQGLSAHGKMTHMEIFYSKLIPEKYFYQFRLWIKSRLQVRMTPAETGFILGLLAGDRSEIPEVLQNDFRRTGLIHVLSISGFHVVLLSGILMLFLKATFLPHHIVRFAAIILLLVYIPVTGGSAAVTRAVFMFVVIQSAALFQKKTDSLNSLGVALLAIVLFRPEELWNAGFQLSAAATAGIIIGQKYYPLKRFTSKIKKRKILSILESFFLESSWVTLMATLSTTPFLIYHFQSLSPISWIGNIFVVPLISFAMQAGLFALIIPVDALRFLFADAAAFFLRLAVLITSNLSKIPGAMLTVGPFSTEVLLLFALILLFLPFFKRNFISRKFILSSALFLCMLFSYVQIKILTHPQWSVVVLDAGQADCIFIETPLKKAFLIDAGISRKRDFANDKIIPFLRNRGILQLEALIITHPDADHFGGAATLMKSFPVNELWISECSRLEEKPEWIQVLSAAFENRIPVFDVQRGLALKETIKIPLFEPHSWEMRFLHPDSKQCRGSNEESITVHIKGPGGTALLTGDLTHVGEIEILKTDISIQSDFLKLGHHGSKTSSSEDFLKAVNPRFTAASSGKNNRYQHPSKSVVEKLQELSIPLLNTAETGSIFIDYNKNSYVVRCFPENQFCSFF